MAVSARSSSAPAATTPPWTWFELVACFLVAWLGSGLAFSAYVGVRDLGADVAPSDLSLGAQVLLAVPIWLGFLGGPVAVVLRRREPISILGLELAPRDVPLGLAIGIVCQWPGVLIVSWPLTTFFDVSFDDIEERAELLVDKADGAVGVALLVLMVGVMAPIAEEVLFRGFLQPLLARSLSPWLAIGSTAMIFAVTHFEPVQIPALFAFGVVLSWLTARFGRLGPAIWAHVGFNVTTVVLLLS